MSFLKNLRKQVASARFNYTVTFLSGLALSAILVQNAWETTLKKAQDNFRDETLPIQQTVTRNVSTSNNVINNIAAFMSSDDTISSVQFQSFATDILAEYNPVEAINYYSFAGDDELNEFRLKYQFAKQNIIPFAEGQAIYSDGKYRNAIDLSIATGAVVLTPSEIKTYPVRKYWLFKPIYIQKDTLPVRDKKYSGIVRGIISILVSPEPLLNSKGANSALTITMFGSLLNPRGQTLLYSNGPKPGQSDGFLKIDRLNEKKLMYLPSYSIKIVIEKDLYFSDLEYPLIFVAILLGLGILMLFYGLVDTRIKQEKQLQNSNKIIKEKEEEQTLQLAVAKNEASKVSKMKTDFLAILSHEIKTPLNAVIGVTDLISETRLSKQQSEYVSVIKRAGDALLNLVNDILDLSKMEAEQVIFEELPFNMAQLIEESVEIYAPQAIDKDIEIITRIDPHLNPLRIGDPTRLRQIILNLISNALKFTERGNIIVSLRKAMDYADSRKLLISVADTGIGIPKDKLGSIFAGFVRIDSSTTRKYSGTGLGLAIIRYLVEMMKGDIKVESEEGKGSCFSICFTLPEQNEKIILEKKFAGKKILIIDSNRNVRDNLEEWLSAYGGSCYQAGQIDEAKSLLEKNTDADAIIIDSQLCIKENGENRLLNNIVHPYNVILLVKLNHISIYSELSKINDIKQLLIKPVKQKELFEAVKKIIEISTVDKTVQKKEIVKQTSAKRILLVEDNPDNRLLIKAFLEKTPHTVNEARNGLVAVKLYKQNNYDLVLMDLEMPEMDGYEATSQIRAWEKEQGHSRKPIIALTAHTIKEEIDRCMTAGCDRYLSKPLKKANLLQVIDETG